MWDAFGMRSSVKAIQAGVPDFFVYKCVDTFLFQHDLELQYVEGDGNCLTNSVIAQLVMETDPGAKELYMQIYSRRSVIRHLIANWNVLGEEKVKIGWMSMGSQLRSGANSWSRTKVGATQYLSSL